MTLIRLPIFAALGISAAAMSLPLQAQSGDPIIIGAAIAESGFIAAYDVDPARAARIAIDEINADGGVLGRPLQLITADTRSDIPFGAVAAMEVLEAGAEFVIVTGDFDFGGAAARVANQEGVIAISPFAADPQFGVQGIGPYAFTFATASDTVGTVLAEFATEQGWSTAYALTQTNIQYDLSVSAAFQQRFIALNGEESLLGTDTFSLDDVSIAAHITRIRALPQEPGVLLLSAFSPAGPSALRQIRAAGLTMPVVSGEDMDGDYWLESVPGLSDFYFAAMGSVFGDDPREEVREFLAEFERRHGTHPSTAHTLTGYSVIQALARAIERAGTTDSDAIRAEFHRFEDEPLLVGPTSFDEETHINFARPLAIITVEDGTHRFIEMRAPEVVPSLQVR